MPVKGKSKRAAKKVAAAPLKAKQTTSEKRQKNPLFRASERPHGPGRGLLRKRDLSRVMVWPKYVKLQRQKKTLMQRLKVPPPINQFNHCLDKHTTNELLKLSAKYKPESKEAKKKRLQARAHKRSEGKPDVPETKQPRIRFGLNEVTKLIERKKAKLVVIAHDMVMFMPALCRKFGIPYCIIKSKARLGLITGRKTCACFAFTNVHSEDRNILAKLIEAININFLERYDEIRKQWGGGLLSARSIAKKAKIDRIKDKELQQKLG